MIADEIQGVIVLLGSLVFASVGLMALVLGIRALSSARAQRKRVSDWDRELEARRVSFDEHGVRVK